MHDHNEMEKNYLTGGLFKSIIGSQEYAESFLTSEWLFYSLKELNNFDYSAVICGYLKSVEQLLQKIVMINVDNNCMITMNGAFDVGKEAFRNHVKAYKRDKKTGAYSPIPADTENTRKYIAPALFIFRLYFGLFSTCPFYGAKAKLLKTEEEKR